MPPASLSAAQARRIALDANGLLRGRPAGRVDRGSVRRLAERLGVIQIDSVNVLARAHYVPLFSRLGPYPTEWLDDLAYDRRELFEYWGHEASLVHRRFQPALRWRMAERHAWNGVASTGARRGDLAAELEAAVAADGPIGARALAATGDGAEGDERTAPWWGWGDTKRVLEHLFWAGRVGAIRGANFERLYCHPSRSLPSGLLDEPTPSTEDAHRALVAHAARLHGIGTAKDLADVWRMPVAATRTAIDALVEEATLEPVEVEGWGQLAYRHTAQPVPRLRAARALVSPFDPAMWHRDRVERLHGFSYRIEIYTPAPKRTFGYYVLPFLLGDTFVARVDLKAERRDRVLAVAAAWHEHDLDARGTDVATVAEALAEELRTMAAWLDLDDVVVADRGDLAPALRAVGLSPARG